MSKQPHLNLSEPSLQIASLKLWVHCRQFPLAQDYWDGNWLCVTARCDSGHSSVATRGSIVHLGELVQLLDECERLYESLSGIAKLDCIEPNLSVTLTAQTVGHIDVQIDITPDHMLERHEFKESIDQSYLPAIISQCREILTEYRFAIQKWELISASQSASAETFTADLMNCPNAVFHDRLLLGR